MTKKAKVIIESPYAGDIERNLKYARLCLKDTPENKIKTEIRSIL